MSKKNVSVVIVLLVIVIAGGVFWVLRNNKSSTNSTTQNNTSTSSTSSDGSQSAVITYSEGGFSPSTITVKSGDSITLKNTSSRAMQFDSDPHPIHTDDPELNVGEVGSGQTATVKVVTKGTHGYHNHLNPAQTGTIVVE